jgi:putative transposase
MLEILIATGNPHKVEEMDALFRRLLPAGSVQLKSLKDINTPTTEPVETGSTFEANATIKATSYAAQTGMLCLADDSGLEIDALGGKPGVISSHYSTDGREAGMSRAERDAANNQRVLAELASVPFEKRTARFVCVMCLAAPANAASAFESWGGAFQAPSSPKSFPLPTAKHLSFAGGFEKRRTDLLPHWQHGGSTYSLTFKTNKTTLTPEERDIVANACDHWDGTRIKLHLAVVMPDHVHMLATPIQQPDGTWPSVPWLMQSIKGFTSKQINEMRRVPSKLWQDEYFDRIVRGHEDFVAQLEYFARNPERKGLTERWVDYPHFRGDEIAWRWAKGVGEGWKHTRGLKGPAPTPSRPTEPLLVRGTFEGRIGIPRTIPRGNNGFGYDPLFVVGPDFTTSSAELSPEEKNKRSHRGAAAVLMAEHLKKLL